MAAPIHSRVLGGFGIKPFVCQNVRLFQLVKFDVKGSTAKPQEPLNPFSSFGLHLSNNAFRHQESNQISPAVRSVGVPVWRIGFPHDETPGANLTYPVSLRLGFTRGVSSSLTSNAFKFVYDMRFRRKDAPGERVVSKGLRVFSRQAHVMTTGKGAAICGVTSRSADYVKT
jgi:hypothetical protein